MREIDDVLCLVDEHQSECYERVEAPVGEPGHDERQCVHCVLLRRVAWPEARAVAAEVVVLCATRGASDSTNAVARSVRSLARRYDFALGQEVPTLTICPSFSAQIVPSRHPWRRSGEKFTWH